VNQIAAAFSTGGVALCIALVCLYLVLQRDGRPWLIWISAGHFCIAWCYFHASFFPVGSGFTESLATGYGLLFVAAASQIGPLLLLGIVELTYGRQRRAIWAAASAALLAGVVGTWLAIDGRTAFGIAQTFGSVAFVASGLMLVRRQGPFAMMVGVMMMYRGLAAFAITYYATSPDRSPYFDLIVYFNQIALVAIGFGFTLMEFDETRRRLLRADAVKNNFLANMSHELRTPLNAILGFSEIMHSEVFGEMPRRYHAYVDDIRIAGRQLLLLIDQLLDMAAIDVNRTSTEIKSFILNQLLEDVVTMLQPRASAKGIQIDVQGAETEVTAVQDERIIRQILLNILDNAVKFSPARRPVTVSVRTEAGGWATISVRDDGPGISPGHRDRLFTVFWQADSNAMRSREGLGLGLALSQRLARAVGARISVESEIGQGSTFTLRLPLEAPQGAGWGSQTKPDKHSSGG